MQRYRINYHWLIGFFASSLVLAATAYFMWSWQVSRKAGLFLTRAEQALIDESPLEAFRSYNKYIQLRPKEEDARIKMAKAAIEVIQDAELAMEERGLALGMLEQTVRTVDDPELRRELAKIVIGFRPLDAIEHIDTLLADNPNDSELNALRVRALFLTKSYDEAATHAFKLVGYDKLEGTFDSEKSLLQGEPEVYVLLANIIAQKEQDSELARQVIDQMVAMNPELPQAYLQQSLFLAVNGEKEQAVIALDKAYELDPQDATILSRKGVMAMDQSNYKKIKADYRQAVEDYEAVIEELTAGKLVPRDESSYQKFKQQYREAVTDYEKSSPTREEALASYVTAKDDYQQAFTQLSEQALAVSGEAPSVETRTRYAEIIEKCQQLALEYEQSKPNYELAKEFFALGLEKHGEIPMFYRLIAEAEQGLGQKQAALDILNLGIAKLKKDQSIDLVLSKIDLLLDAKDYSGIEQELERLRLANRPALIPVIDFQLARIAYDKRQWANAARELKRVRPLLLERRRLQAMAGVMLGRSYESLGMSDLALKAYSTVLNDQPKNQFARQGAERIKSRIQPETAGTLSFQLDQLVKRVAKLPEEEQDWDQVEKLVQKVIQDKKMSKSGELLLRAQVSMHRGKFEDAKKTINAAFAEDKEDINVQYAAILLYASDPERGSEAAFKLLDRLEQRKGRTLRSRSLRAKLFVVFKGENVTTQLQLLLSDMEGLSEAEQLQLRKNVGLKFEQLGQINEARQVYKQVIELEPNNLPIRMHAFDLALRQQDDDAISKAQAVVLQFVKSKSHPNYLLTEVKRRIFNYSQNPSDRGQLEECRQLLDTALGQRKEWHELHILYGQLLLLLGEETELALQYFDDALKYGPPKSNALGLQIKILAERGLFAQARERMMRMREDLRSRLLGRLEVEILLNTGDTEVGYEKAKKLAASQPNNSQLQVWRAEIAQQQGDFDSATSSLLQAVKANPANPDNWMKLVGLYSKQKEYLQLEQTIRAAHLASDADYLPLLTGKYEELFARWQSAEAIYLTTFSDRLDELTNVRRMAEFYLVWSKNHEGNLGKAAIFINRILRLANENKVASNDPNVIWARQKAAGLLLRGNDYQQSLKAEKLLRQSSDSSRLTDSEAELLTNILISRNDPKSLLEAKQLLFELKRSTRLTKKGAMQLALILGKSGDWKAANELMLEQLADYPEDSQVRTTYINLLIDQGDYTQAERTLRRLKNLDANNLTKVQLAVRLAAERGDQAQLNKLLKSLLPQTKGAMNESQLGIVLQVAKMAAHHGAIELAASLHQTYARRTEEYLELAKFISDHGEMDQAVELLKRLYSDHTDEVVKLASVILARRRDEFGDTYDAPLNRLFDAAVREDPDSIARQFARADAYGSQDEFKKSIAIYDEILARDDLSIRMRATALNNLGFHLGLLNQRVDEAEQMVNEAIETFGPVEDMLDTRAVVRIARGAYDLAIEDMELALSVSNDPVKFYHLAKAYVLFGKSEAASKAWERAQELGFEQKSLSRLERATFEEIRQRIENPKVENAKI